MITVPTFKGKICEQTRNAVVNQIAKDTKKIFSQHLENIKTKLLSNSSQIDVQIKSFMKKFSQQYYVILARQVAKQEEQKIWKGSEDFQFFTRLQRLFARNQQQELSPKLQILQTHNQASKCSQSQAKKSQVLPIPPFQKETIIKQVEKENQSKLGAQSKVLQASKFPLEQIKPQQTNPFTNTIPKNPFSSVLNANTASIFSQTSSNHFGNKSPSQLSNQNSKNDQTQAKPNIFTTKSDPKNSQIFGSHISSQQFSRDSSGIMGLQGIFCSTKISKNQAKVNNLLQFSSEPTNNSPSLFNLK